jgi:hypothetical protein
MRRAQVLAAVVLGLLFLAVLAVAASRTGDQDAVPEPEVPDRVPDPVEASAPVTPAPLLPNLRSLGATDLQVEVLAGVRRLRFAASLANLGPGPLVLVPRGRGECPAGQHGSLQVRYVDSDGDGRYDRRRDTAQTRSFAGCMVRHPGHDHWHFDAMARYTLRRPDADRPLAQRPKVSFCLRDNRRVPGQPVVVRREHFGECTRTGPQGISPGWVDVYDADLAGQWLPLPEGTGGLLCLELAADPGDLVEEADETDNATVVGIRVDGDAVRRVPDTACLS